MNMKDQSLLVPVIVAGLAGATAQAQPIEVDEPFPIILLPSMKDGAPMSVADFRGRRILLHVFASW